jgi:hypothetical protein
VANHHQTRAHDDDGEADPSRQDDVGGTTPRFVGSRVCDECDDGRNPEERGEVEEQEADSEAESAPDQQESRPAAPPKL